MRLIEFHDYVWEMRDAGRYTYVSSIDVAAAFDNVPHSFLMQTVTDRGVDRYLCRYIDVWLKKRIFRMRLTTADGQYFSGWKPVSKGVPQGGVLSPFLLLLHINPFPSRVIRAMRALVGDQVWRCLRILIYADDMMCALAHENLEMITKMAEGMAATSEAALSTLALSSETAKSESFLTKPNFGDSGLFCRHPMRLPPDELHPPTGAQPQMGSTGGDRREASGGHSLVSGLPYRLVADFRLLGITFDDQFSFKEQYNRILSLAKKRLAIVTKVGGFSLGLETNMLRLTCEALVVSLLRYGLAIVGSGLSDMAMAGLDTCVPNIMARKISGVPRTAGVPVLRAVSGVLSAHNLFIQHCASTVDLGLRASGSTLQRLLNLWLCRIYGIRSWEADAQELTPPPRIPPPPTWPDIAISTST